MSDSVTSVIRGTLNWAKILGEPRMNTFTEEREWSVDVTPDENSMKIIKALKITERLREPKENDPREEPFLSFRQKEFRTNASTGEKTANRPITVVGVDGRPWDQSSLLGNGTLADIKFRVKNFGKGKPVGVYLQAVRILEHVPFEREEFAPLTAEEQEKFAATSEDFSGTDSADAPW